MFADLRGNSQHNPAGSEFPSRDTLRIDSYIPLVNIPDLTGFEPQEGATVKKGPNGELQLDVLLRFGPDGSEVVRFNGLPVTIATDTEGLRKAA